MNVLLSTAYFPPVLWMAAAVQASSVTLEHCENFQKQTYRSRAHIYGPNGIQKLSVPVDRKAQSIAEVPIRYEENWVKDHLGAIATAYANAPFFEVLYPDIEEVLIRSYESLWSLNEAIMQLMFQWLDVEFEPNLTESYNSDFKGFDNRWLNPKNKMDTGVYFEPYHQVFSHKNGFQNNLSAMDVFFNLGRGSWDYFQELDLGPLQP
jgi:hypothetical protein